MLFRSALVALCALSPLAYASPIYRRQHETSPARRDSSPNPEFSFNGWRGNANLGNFDGFYGSGNFGGGRNRQVVIVKEKLVCSQRDIRIVQQKLAILLELSKRILLEQVCDVVTQVLIFQQFNSGHRQFGRDISRKSGREVGFDQDIAGRFGNIFDQQGGLNVEDLGFDGLNIGGNLREFTDNWDDNSSRGEVDDLLEAVRQAGGQRGGKGKGNNNGEVEAPPAEEPAAEEPAAEEPAAEEPEAAESEAAPEASETETASEAEPTETASVVEPVASEPAAAEPAETPAAARRSWW